MWEDQTLKSYILFFIISTYDFILFLTWGLWAWAREGRKPSAIYVAITLLFLSLANVAGLNAWVRMARFSDIDNYLALMNTQVWALRHIPCILILAGIGAFMTRRVFWSYFFKNKMNRLIQGKRKTDITEF